MFKKIIASVICASVAALSILPASAASVTVTGKETIKTSGILVFYTYNVSSTSKAFVNLKNDTTGESQSIKFGEIYNHPYSVKISPKDTYYPFIGVSLGGSGGSGGGTGFVYSKTTGKYETIKIKLSDFSDYFNTDGSHTQGDHKYIFQEEPKLSNGDQYTSVLVFESGGAFTCAVPDKNGEVEIHVKRAIGARIYFSTDFHYVVSNTSGGITTGGGGGKNHQALYGLTIGDSDKDGYVDIDDVTKIQQYCAGTAKFDKAAERNADVDANSTVSIDDVTMLQRYLAGFTVD